MKELKGICENCLGCNRLELENFEGLKEYEFFTSEQIEIEKEKIND